MSLQKSYLGSAKTYIFSKNQINNMEFFLTDLSILILFTIFLTFKLSKSSKRLLNQKFTRSYMISDDG